MSRASNSSPQKRPQTNQGNTLVGVFIGLVIGVLISAALAWYFSGIKGPVDKPGAGASTPASTQSGVIILDGNGKLKKSEDDNSRFDPKKETATPPTPTSTPRADASPAAPASGTADSNSFEFYNLLPKGDQAPPPPRVENSAPIGANPDKYYLQLGAFSDPSQVDNIKAQLALMGIEASVQRLETPDKGTLHRVRVGPYLRADDLNVIRSQLDSAGIKTTIVRVKPKDSGAPAPAR